MFTTITTFLRNSRALLAAGGIATLAQTASAQSPGQPPRRLAVVAAAGFSLQGAGRPHLPDFDPATFPQIVRPPKGAPNIVLILLDDAGFGQFSTFGGGVSSPNMESSRRRACATTASTRPRCARRRGRRCSPAATTT